MKVFIITEGGRNIGFGHVTRCSALYEAFEKEGLPVQLIINGDDSLNGLLNGKKYTITNWLNKKNNPLYLLQRQDLAIIDSYLADEAIYKSLLNLTSGRLVIIDDYNRLEYTGGIVINPSIYGDKLSYVKKRNLTYLLGRDYIILRKAFWDMPKKDIHKKIKNVLVTFGGINYNNLLCDIKDYIKRQFGFYSIEGAKGGFSDAEMLRLMLKADVCISGGGQTTYELARTGLPTIGICFAENQKLNLKGWQKKGFIEYAGWCDSDTLLKKIKEAFNRLTYRKRLGMNKIGRMLVDGRGAGRIVKKVSELLNI